MSFTWWYGWVLTVLTSITIWIDIQLGMSLRNYNHFKSQISDIFDFTVGDYFNYKLNFSSIFIVCLILKFIFLIFNFVYGILLSINIFLIWNESKIAAISSLILASLIFFTFSFEMYIYSYVMDVFVNAKFEYSFEDQLWYWTGDIDDAWFKKDGIVYMNSDSNYYEHVRLILGIALVSKVQVIASPMLNSFSEI